MSYLIDSMRGPDDKELQTISIQVENKMFVAKQPFSNYFFLSIAVVVARQIP